MSTPSTTFRAAAFALSLVVTLVLLGSVDLIATAQPPAALLAKMAQALPHA